MGRLERFDARPGGSYRMVLTYSGASGAPGKATAEADIVGAPSHLPREAS
jgi:hypothetical protein